MPDILEQRPADGVALLRLNRPEIRNALSVTLRQELARIVRAAGEDPAVRVLVITGNETAFAAGGDLAELRTRTLADTRSPASVAAWVALAACRKPLIAAVNGMALGGGCELALHCDLIIAGESALFGQPEVTIGLAPGAGGIGRLVRAAGRYRALSFLLTGRTIPAGMAYAAGLVSELVPDSEVLPRALALARAIAALPQAAVRSIKQAARLGLDTPLGAASALDAVSARLLEASDIALDTAPGGSAHNAT